MTPEALQIIVRAGAREEYVHDEIAVVLQDPLGVLVAFDADGHLALSLHLEIDFVTYGLVLACVGAGADQEVIGKGGNFPKIEDSNVLRLLRPSGASGDQPIYFSSLRGSILLAGTW